jgi:hypothetical protein
MVLPQSVRDYCGRPGSGLATSSDRVFIHLEDRRLIICSMCRSGEGPIRWGRQAAECHRRAVAQCKAGVGVVAACEVDGQDFAVVAMTHSDMPRCITTIPLTHTRDTHHGEFHWSPMQ